MIVLAFSGILVMIGLGQAACMCIGYLLGVIDRV